MVETAIGEALGKLYVAKYFPAESKQRMQALVQNLMTAYQQSINTLDWMSDATKQAAQDKLSKFTVKIGYPDQWRDYSKLQIKVDDLVGNIATENFLGWCDQQQIGLKINRTAFAEAFRMAGDVFVTH